MTNARRAPVLCASTGWPDQTHYAPAIMLRLAIVFGYVSHSSGVARQRRWRVLAQHRRALDRAPQEEYAYVGGIQCVRSPVMYDLLDACGWLRRPWRSTRLKSGRAPEAISPAQEAWQRDCLTRLREVGLVSTDTPIRLWRHQSRFLRDLRSHCWAFSESLRLSAAYAMARAPHAAHPPRGACTCANGPQSTLLYA